jgi:hypothetical protein
MSDQISAVVAAALDQVLSDNGWLAGSRPAPLRAALSDVLGPEADTHRAELDALVVSAEEGIPSRMRTAGRAGAAGLASELTERLVAWGMAESLAASVVDTWASLVPETSSSAPVVHDDPTVVSQSAGAPAGAAPPATPQAPAAPVQVTGSEGATPSPAEPSAPTGARGRRYLWVAGGVAVAVVVAAVGWLGFGRGGGEHGQHDQANVVLESLAKANDAYAKGLIPPKSCTAMGDHVMCTDPNPAVTQLDVRTYPDKSELYAAYTSAAQGLRGAPLEQNVGDCNARQKSGEVSWNHQFEHPTDYTIDDHITTDLTMGGEAEGRLACEVSGGFMTIVWTDDAWNMLGQARGPVMSLFPAWRRIHHGITPPASGMMDMDHDAPSAPSSQSTPMGDMESSPMEDMS